MSYVVVVLVHGNNAGPEDWEALPILGLDTRWNSKLDQCSQVHDYKDDSPKPGLFILLVGPGRKGSLSFAG